MKIEKKKLRTFSDDRGGILAPIEFKDLEFKPKRAFYVTGVPAGNIRGEHAHFNTKQLLICVQGEIVVILTQNESTETITLNKDEYLYVGNLIWDAQCFVTGHDVLLVLCSTNYDLKDYILDMDDFLKYKFEGDMV